MPNINWNKSTWDGKYQWDNKGDEWSAPWGGSDMQWYGTILPRIHKYITDEKTDRLKTATILEIAPGCGRWTNYLKNICDRLILVDLSEQCIETCKDRFSSFSNIDFHVNDGKSLSMIPDNSIDFVFSMDSLVHCEVDVIDSYLNQLSVKLKSDGIGFFHHSNLGEYIDPEGIIIGNKDELDKLYSTPLHNRGKTVSANIFRSIGEKYDLQLISQELINWAGSQQTVDCLSIFVKCHSKWSKSNSYERLVNTNFTSEYRQLRLLSRLYSY
jgi:ubiquinone/menaquinone biosynthesis C-methylase UbiE